MLLSLTAKDLLQSVAWYRDVLGFTVDNVREHDGKPAAASMRSGTARIFLNQDDGGRGWERVKGEGVSITFDTAQDVNAIAERIKSKGWRLAMEPADMPWGVRHAPGRGPGWLSARHLETAERVRRWSGGNQPQNVQHPNFGVVTL